MDKLAFLEMRIEQMRMLDLMQKQAQEIRERPWIFPLIGTGLGAAVGGIAGAAGAKDKKSKLRRALLGAGIGAAGGGAGAYLLRGSLVDEARKGLESGKSFPVTSSLMGLGVGAAGGAAAGYGSSKDNETRKRRAAKGAVIGGTLGGILGLSGGSAANRIGSQVRSMMQDHGVGGRLGGSVHGFPQKRGFPQEGEVYLA